jgi:hypothetical protein
MKILVLSDSSRELFTHTPDLIALALRDLGHDIEIWHRGFFTSKPLGYIRLSAYINEKYDMIIYVNSRQQIIDLKGVINPIKVFLYYESYGCPTVPKGTEIILTDKTSNELLVYANFKNYMNAKLVNFDLVKPMVAPKHWKYYSHYKKDIEFRYNGNLNNQTDLFILNAWMRDNIDFMNGLKDICSDLELPKKDENYDTWKERFYRTKINVHISSKYGVGQGAYESGLTRACLIEYPKTNIAKKEGLIDGKNCFLVSSIHEAKECYEQLKNDINLQNQFKLELLKVAYRHTYKVIKPHLKMFFNQIKSLRG